jgi:hypothetical protein
VEQVGQQVELLVAMGVPEAQVQHCSAEVLEDLLVLAELGELGRLTGELPCQMSLELTPGS